MSLMQKSKKVMGLLLVMLMMVSLTTPISVFADPGQFLDGNTERVVGAGNIKGYLGQAVKAANDKLGFEKESKADDHLYVDIKGVATPLAKVDTEGVMVIDMETWKAAKSDNITKTMKTFVDCLDATAASDDAVKEFMQTFEDTDRSVSSVMLPMVFRETKANIYEAYKIVEPFLDVLNIVLGVGCVALILLLLFSTVMDLAYIGLPVWREAQEAKNGAKKHPFGVSYEALRTVEETEKNLGGGDGEYKNAYLLYFKRRALTYIILAICIMYLICGGLSGIISFVLSLTGGIV